jgi:putative membrane protein
MKQFVSEHDAQRISEAIQQVERHTSGELVTVIAASSDNYNYIPILWAALLALLIPGPFYFGEISWFIEHEYILQLGCFVVAALVMQLPPIKSRIIPGAVRRQRAHRHAMEQFILNNLPATREANGVLLFVSVAERYVEIIADKGVNDVVAEGTWDEIVQSFTSKVRRGEIADGFIDAIHACGKILTTHFPVAPDDVNELPDHLVIV